MTLSRARRLTILVSLLVSLGAAEGAARYYLLRLHTPSGTSDLSGHSICGDYFTFDAETGWWGKRNLDCVTPHEGGAFAVRTNSDGLRGDREYGAKRPGVLRVGVFGDSFTFGSGVRAEDTYASVLERRVPGIEVMNFGLVAGGPDQSLLALQRKAARFELDAVIVAPLVENITRIVSTEWGDEKPYFTLVNGTLQLHNSPVPARPGPTRQESTNYTPALWELLRTAARPAALSLGVYKPYATYYDGPPGELLDHILRAFRDTAPHAALIFAPLPTYHYIEYDFPPDYEEVFQRAARATGATYVDVLSAFKRLTPAQRQATRFRFDQHYSPLGHQVVGQALAPYVAALRTSRLATHIGD